MKGGQVSAAQDSQWQSDAEWPPSKPQSSWLPPMVPTTRILPRLGHQCSSGPPLACPLAHPSVCPASFDDLPLTAVPRPGKPVRLTDDQVTKIIALACEPPPDPRD